EGHNAFFADPEAAKNPALPREVFAFIDRQFAEEYPPDRRCDDPSRGCWRPARPKAQDGFALSTDGILDRAPYSRRVTGIDFTDPLHARLGVLNEGFYNWPPNASDIERFDRDRRTFNLFNRYRATFPLYIMYRFPPAFAGSALCWRGDVLWENAAERFEVLSHAGTACRTIVPEEAGRRTFAMWIKRDHPLAMTLEPSWTVRLRDLFATALTIAGVVGILGLLVRVEARRLLLPAVLIGASLLLIGVIDINFIGGYRPLDGGDDGLT